MPAKGYTSVTLPEYQADRLTDIATEENCRSIREAITRLMDIREEHARLKFMLDQLRSRGSGVENAREGVKNGQTPFTLIRTSNHESFGSDDPFLGLSGCWWVVVEERSGALERMRRL